MQHVLLYGLERVLFDHQVNQRGAPAMQTLAYV